MSEFRARQIKTCSKLVQMHQIIKNKETESVNKTDFNSWPYILYDVKSLSSAHLSIV